MRQSRSQSHPHIGPVRHAHRRSHSRPALQIKTRVFYSALKSWLLVEEFSSNFGLNFADIRIEIDYKINRFVDRFIGWDEPEDNRRHRTPRIWPLNYLRPLKPRLTRLTQRSPKLWHKHDWELNEDLALDLWSKAETTASLKRAVIAFPLLKCLNRLSEKTLSTKISVNVFYWKTTQCREENMCFSALKKRRSDVRVISGIVCLVFSKLPALLGLSTDSPMPVLSLSLMLNMCEGRGRETERCWPQTRRRGLEGLRGLVCVVSLNTLFWLQFPKLWTENDKPMERNNRLWRSLAERQQFSWGEWVRDQRLEICKTKDRIILYNSCGRSHWNCTEIQCMRSSDRAQGGPACERQRVITFHELRAHKKHHSFGSSDMWESYVRHTSDSRGTGGQRWRRDREPLTLRRAVVSSGKVWRGLAITNVRYMNAKRLADIPHRLLRRHRRSHT